MVERTATVLNAAGIHCRPSAMIVQALRGYRGKVQVQSDTGATDLRSLIALVALGLEQGQNVRIRVCGPDEERMCARVVELFETHYDFPALPPDERARVAEAILSERRAEAPALRPSQT